MSVYGKYSGTDLKHEGKDYLIMKESDILAIMQLKTKTWQKI